MVRMRVLPHRVGIRWTVVDHNTPFDYHGPPRKRSHGSKGVGNQKDRRAGTVKCLEGRREALLVGEVDARDRFVHDKDGGISCQSPSDQDALLLAGGKRFDPSRGDGGQVDEFEGPLDRGSIGRTVSTEESNLGGTAR